MSKFNETLFNNNQTIGGSETEMKLLFEQYKLYVSTMEKLVERRQVANSFFLTANALLITLSGFGIEQLGIENSSARSFSLLGICVSGILLSTIWIRLSRYYGLMNKAKFCVIHALEKKLPAALFLGEWIALGEGKDPQKYQPMSAVESKVTWIFIYLYTAIALWSIYASIVNFLSNNV